MIDGRGLISEGTEERRKKVEERGTGFDDKVNQNGKQV